MYISKASLLNFKNIRDAELAFSGNINCFVGDNGAGKTNVLDAVYYLSMCKSAFNLTDGQSVNHDSDFFIVEGSYVIGGRHETVSCSFRKGAGKVLKRAGKEYEKLSEHIGLLPVVLVSPCDNSLINESGEDRRRFLNAVISQTDRAYLNTLIKYNRLLAERNKLLKGAGSPGFSSVLEVLDMQISAAGDEIYAKRRRLVEDMAPVVAKYYGILSGDREQVSVSYRSDLDDGPMAEALTRASERDRVMQHTTAGIHRDDLRMGIGGHSLRKYGSQGQQKSFLIALKLAQFEIIAAACGYRPILLLDDIFDKLDMQRVERLIRTVSEERFGQIFITDSNKVRLGGILDGIDREYKLFTVDGGEVKG